MAKGSPLNKETEEEKNLGTQEGRKNTTNKGRYNKVFFSLNI